MARIGIAGKVSAFTKFVDAIPVLDAIFNALENTINGQLDVLNIQNDAITTPKIKDAAVTTPKLGSQAVTSLNVDTTVAKIASAQYTGTGVADREVNLGFRARFVVVLNHTTRGLYIAFGGTGSAFARVQIDSSGNITDGGTDFTGSSANGFQLGSAGAGGGSNTNLVVYSYIALG